MLKNLIFVLLSALFLISCSQPYCQEGYLINSWIETKEVESVLLEEYLLTYEDFCMSFTEDGLLYIYTEEYGLEEHEWCIADDGSFQTGNIQMKFEHISKETWDVKISHKDFTVSTTGVMGSCQSIDPTELPYEPLTLDELYQEDLRCYPGSGPG